MRLALLTAANPRVINEGHPCLIGSGVFRFVADGDIKSELTIRCESIKRTSSVIKKLGESINGPTIATVIMINASPEDSRISVYAERVE